MRGNGLPGVDTIVVSTQHDPDVTQERIRDDIVREVITPVIPGQWLDGNTKILINPTGRVCHRRARR